MAEMRDWAVIVGVQLYPGISDLEGPVLDAMAFEEWVKDPSGGNVDPGQVLTILSPNPPPAGFDVWTAKPIEAEVSDAFEQVRQAVYPDKQGRRLYIYMAGHGIEPTSNQPAVLMANAGERRLGYHVLGRAYADWFFRAAAFTEILLFMDCCRDNYPAAPIRPVPWDPEVFPDPVGVVKYLYAFATQWTRRSRERTIQTGAGKRGVFTYALIEGLKGAASRADGYVTMASLQTYLNDNVKRFLAPEDRDAADVPQQPDFARNPPGGEGFVICQVPSKKWDVRVRLPSSPPNPDLQIDFLKGAFDSNLGGFPPVARVALAGLNGASPPTLRVDVQDPSSIGDPPSLIAGADPPTLGISLIKGTYIVQTPGTPIKPFEVPNPKEVDGHALIQL
jgi:hypothetical protein